MSLQAMNPRLDETHSAAHASTGSGDEGGGVWNRWTMGHQRPDLGGGDDLATSLLGGPHRAGERWPNGGHKSVTGRGGSGDHR
jgi:hypothetical protein